ncbi:hypothetical protein Golomagni_03185 [Golovinomyces magnicellulatus]|nr:hypothetical protein Golomagni_03185 [Golovinomyces magnicellulatus]
MSSPRSKNISSNCDIKNNLLRAENRPGPMDKVHTPARELSLDNRNIISVGDKFQSTTFSKELSFNTPEAGYNAMIPARQSSNSVQKIKFDQTLATEIDEASISEMVDPFHKASSKIRNISNSHRLDPDHESENDIRDDKTIRMLLEKSHWIDGLENQSELRQKKDKVILAHYADQKTSLRPHNYTLILSSAENLNELAQINRPATTLPVIRVSPAKAAPAKKIYDPCKQNLENKIAVKISSPLPHITFGQNKEESRPSCVPKENYRTTDRLKNHSNPGFYDSDYNDYRLTSSRKSNEDIDFSSAYGEQEKRCEKNQHSIQNFAGDYNNRLDSISPRDYHLKVPNQTIESCPNSPIDNLSSSILAVNKEKHEEKYYFLSQVDPYQDSYQCFSCEDFDTFNFDMGLNEKLFSVKDTGKSTADYNTYDTIDQKADQYIDLDNDQSIYSNSDLAQHEQSYCTYLESNKLNTIFHNETTDNLNGFTSHETSKKKNTPIDTPGYFSWQKSAGFEDLSYFRRCPEDLKEIEDFWCVHRRIELFSTFLKFHMTSLPTKRVSWILASEP